MRLDNVEIFNSFSFNDKENGLGFFTTPTGLRMDAQVANDALGRNPLNLSWNSFWDAKTS